MNNYPILPKSVLGSNFIFSKGEELRCKNRIFNFLMAFGNPRKPGRFSTKILSSPLLSK
jgi:hypothetical protein